MRPGWQAGWFVDSIPTKMEGVNGKDRRGKGKIYGKNLSDQEIRLNEKLSTCTLYWGGAWTPET